MSLCPEGKPTPLLPLLNVYKLCCDALLATKRPGFTVVNGLTCIMIWLYRNKGLREFMSVRWKTEIENDGDVDINTHPISKLFKNATNASVIYADNYRL